MRGIEVQELQVEPHHAAGSLVLVCQDTPQGRRFMPGMVLAIVNSEDSYLLDVEGRNECAGCRWFGLAPADVKADFLDAPEAA